LSKKLFNRGTKLDITHASSIGASLDKVADLDVLIDNAGIAIYGPISA
jgi:NADP-dependent 3-hydroxy acid dehydrogenase YdfG